MALLLPLLPSCRWPRPSWRPARCPSSLINVLADWFPQYSIEFQYVAVIVPFLVAAAILGLARLRRARRPAAMARLLSHDGAVAVVWVGVVLVAGAVPGPAAVVRTTCPAIGSDQRVEQYRVGHHARVLERAVALIPDDVPVSAANLPGAHLSERERIYTFPVIDDARWVIVDRHRPYVADRLDPIRFPPYLARASATAPTCAW